MKKEEKMRRRILSPNKRDYQKILGKITDNRYQGSGKCGYCSGRCLSCGKSGTPRFKRFSGR